MRTDEWPGVRMKGKYGKAEGRKSRLQTADGGWKDGRKGSEWWRDTAMDEGMDGKETGKGGTR